MATATGTAYIKVPRRGRARALFMASKGLGKYGQANGAAGYANGVDKHNHARNADLMAGAYGPSSGGGGKGHGGVVYGHSVGGGKGGAAAGKGFNPATFNPADYYEQEEDYSNYNNSYWGSDMEGAAKMDHSWGASGANGGMPHGSDSDLANAGNDRANVEAQKATVSQLMLLANDAISRAEASTAKSALTEADTLLRKLIGSIEKDLATSHIVARFDAFWSLYINFNADNATIKTMIREKFDSTLDKAGGPAALTETAEVIRSFLPDIPDAVALVDKALNKNREYLEMASRLLSELKEAQEKRQRVNTASARVDVLSKMLAQAETTNAAGADAPPALGGEPEFPPGLGATDAESLAKMLGVFGATGTGYENGMVSTEAEGSATEAEGTGAAHNMYASSAEEQVPAAGAAQFVAHADALASMLAHLAAESPSDGSGSLDVAALSGFVLPPASELQFGTSAPPARGGSDEGLATEATASTAEGTAATDQLLASYMELVKLSA